MNKTFYDTNKTPVPNKYSVRDIAVWHEEALPLATAADQKKKFAEEFKEWSESHDIFELADMYIVACGMTRYPTLDAQIAFHKINEECLLNHILSKTLLDAVDSKMGINKHRQWKRLASGVYKHIS